MNGQQTSIPRVPPRLVIASIVGLWLCYFGLATLRGWVVGFDLDWQMLSRRIAVTFASMAVTAALWPLLWMLRRRALWLQALAVAAAALPGSLLLAGINQWVFSDIESEVVAKIGASKGINIRRDEAGNVLVDIPEAPRDEDTAGESVQVTKGTTVVIDAGTHDDNRWRQVTDLALGRYFLLLAWAALYLALANAQQARAAERREGEFRRAAKAAELQSLRYQVNPHFLFNTLNSLSALVMTGRTQSAERMIQTMSTFYRRSLADDPTAEHSLAEEIELQKLYLEIEAVRFPDRLRSVFDIPANLADALVPGLILQPLIENSVKYAVAASKQAVTITVAASEANGQLVLTVSDDGPGNVPDSGSNGDAPGFGIGLANVRDRLEGRFGAQASLEARGLSGGYITVIRLPLVRSHG